MVQRWAELGFLHWEVELDVLCSLLPPGLTLDTFQGKAYIGLVPFTMTGVRPVGIPPFPPLSNVHEVNVRTYVHLNGANPGVWFFSLDAASELAVQAARHGYKLPYFRADMRAEWRGGRLEYESRRPRHVRRSSRRRAGASPTRASTAPR